jgi:hypothetical protein
MVSGIGIVTMQVMKISLWLKTAILIVFVIQLGQVSHAAAVRISWLGNAEADLEGYKVYYGTSTHSYQEYIDIGRVTSADIDGLSEGVTYYFAVTAYDITGNESAYSQEVQTSIPVQGGDTTDGGNGTPPGGDTGDLEPQADSDSDGIPDNVEVLWSLDLNNPLDSLFDADGDGIVNLVEYMAGTDPLDPADRPNTDDILKDLIGEVNEPIDLSDMNPTGEYTIMPLMASYPEVVDNMLDLSEPGAYLYNVYNANGSLVYRLRVSITSELFAAGSFTPGAPLTLEELSIGIAIQLMADAALREVPIGIGNTPYEPASAVSYDDGNGLEFDLLPYGLALAQPAIISVNFDKEAPIVQRYDANENTWKNITDFTVADCLVTFSTQELGKFRIYSEAKDTADVPVVASGGSGGGCFIASAEF